MSGAAGVWSDSPGVNTQPDTPCWLRSNTLLIRVRAQHLQFPGYEEEKRAKYQASLLWTRSVSDSFVPITRLIWYQYTGIISLEDQPITIQHQHKLIQTFITGNVRTSVSSDTTETIVSNSVSHLLTKHPIISLLWLLVHQHYGALAPPTVSECEPESPLHTGHKCWSETMDCFYIRDFRCSLI